jgi:hypothetical protein
MLDGVPGVPPFFWGNFRERNIAMSISSPNLAMVQSPVFGAGRRDDFASIGLDDTEMEQDPRLDAAVEKLSLLIRRYCPTSPGLGNSSDH